MLEISQSRRPARDFGMAAAAERLGEATRPPGSPRFSASASARCWTLPRAMSSSGAPRAAATLLVASIQSYCAHLRNLAQGMGGEAATEARARLGSAQGDPLRKREPGSYVARH
jgi:hypothetical protein